MGEARAILFPLSIASYRRLFSAIAAAAAVLVLLLVGLPAAEAQQCVPGRPLTPRVDSDRTTTITVTWLEPSNECTSPITDYDYRYKEITDPIWTEVTDTTITRRWIEIFGLEPDTVYDVQIRAVNAEGAGPWSPYGSWKTLPLPATPTPEPTATPTPEPTATPTPEPTATPTPEPTATPTPQPTATPTPQPTATPRPTATSTPRPTATPTPEPTATPTPRPTATLTPTPTPAPTATATPPEPTVTPEPTATATATPTPLAIWTATPTPPPTPRPTATPWPAPPAAPPAAAPPAPPAAGDELSDLAAVLIGLAAAVEAIAVGFLIGAASRREQPEGEAGS